MFIVRINTVLSVDDNTVLSVSLSHQQDAPPRHGTKSQLFKIDGVTSPALVGDQRKLLWDKRFEQPGGLTIWCRPLITKATTGEFQMLEVISNPILGGTIATFAIGMTFTIWSTFSDWMWDRKNK